MDKTALVENDIENGRKLIEALDEADFRVRAALWFYLSDSNEWRLIIASPLVDEKGPKAAYTLVQSVLTELPPAVGKGRFKSSMSGISLNDISVVSPNHDLIQLLRVAVRTGPGIHGLRFTRNTINNTFIEDAYIYRML